MHSLLLTHLPHRSRWLLYIICIFYFCALLCWSSQFLIVTIVWTGANVMTQTSEFLILSHFGLSWWVPLWNYIKTEYAMMMSFKKGGHGLPSRQAVSSLLLACLRLEKAKLSGVFLVQHKAKAVNNQWWAEMWQPRCGTTQGFSYTVFLFKDFF